MVCAIRVGVILMRSMQLTHHCEDDVFVDCLIPHEDIECVDGVKWGKANSPFTPAFWRFICIANDAINDISRYHLGMTLEQEVVACLLGGHGITGEMGMAAYQHLMQHEVIDGCATADDIERLLLMPILLKGRAVHYRFPHQKAKYIAAALTYLRGKAVPDSNRALRDWLTGISGIGMKTASWITRNWRDADDVAILDIHIHRAGVIAGIFAPNDDISKQYLEMEHKFVSLASAIGIPANILDNQIWNEFRNAPKTAARLLVEKGVDASDRCGLPIANHNRARRNNASLTRVQ